MPIKAVQQFMLGTTANNEKQAQETLAAIKNAEYDAIGLCGFMIHPISAAEPPVQQPIGD